MKPMSKEEFDAEVKRKAEPRKPILMVDTSKSILKEELEAVEEYIKDLRKGREGLSGSEIERLKKDFGHKDEIVDFVAVCLESRGNANYTAGKVYRIKGGHWFESRQKLTSIHITDDKGQDKHYSPKKFIVFPIEVGAIIRARRPERYMDIGKYRDEENPIGYEMEIKSMKWVDDHTFEVEYDDFVIDDEGGAIEQIHSNRLVQCSARSPHNLIDELVKEELTIMPKNYSKALYVPDGFDFMEALAEL